MRRRESLHGRRLRRRALPEHTERGRLRRRHPLHDERRVREPAAAQGSAGRRMLLRGLRMRRRERLHAGRFVPGRRLRRRAPRSRATTATSARPTPAIRRPDRASSRDSGTCGIGGTVYYYRDDAVPGSEPSSKVVPNVGIDRTETPVGGRHDGCRRHVRCYGRVGQCDRRNGPKYGTPRASDHNARHQLVRRFRDRPRGRAAARALAQPARRRRRHRGRDGQRVRRVARGAVRRRLDRPLRRGDHAAGPIGPSSAATRTRFPARTAASRPFTRSRRSPTRSKG